jgi:molecular chaperone GrpE
VQVRSIHEEVRVPFHRDPFEDPWRARPQRGGPRDVQELEAQRREALYLAGQMQRENHELREAVRQLEERFGALRGQAEALERRRNELERDSAQLRQSLSAAQQQAAQAQAAAPPPSAARAPAAPDADEVQQRYLRLLADVENMRRRQAQQVASEVNAAKSGLLSDLLPVLDALDRARSAAGATPEVLGTGVQAIAQQLLGALLKQGVERIEPAAGEAFDPEQQEALAIVASAQVPEGHVVECVRPGYRLGERLLRPAQVVVASPAQEGGAS